ncbi:MAG: hypothetical protein AAFV88_18320, partial [Planctomycetota bacterium]
FRKALSIGDDPKDPDFAPCDKSKSIQEGFEVLAFHLERCQHYIEIGLIQRDDVDSPTAYYVGRMARFKKEITGYLEATHYPRAIELLESFDEWRRAR